MRAGVGVAVALLVASEAWLGWLLPTQVMAADRGPLPADAAPPEVADAVMVTVESRERPPRDLAATAPVAVPPPLAVAPPQPAAEPPRPEEIDPAWKATQVAMLPRDLGQMGPSLKLGLDAARRSDMDFCFKKVQVDPDAPPKHRDGMLMLYLTTREGAVDVVDARLAQPGDIPPEVLECCREVLRGMQVGVFFAVPGQRLRFLYEIEE